MAAATPTTTTKRAPAARRRRRFTRRTDGRGSGRAGPEHEPDGVRGAADGRIAQLAGPLGRTGADHDALAEAVDDEGGAVASRARTHRLLRPRRDPTGEIHQGEVANEAGRAEDVHLVGVDLEGHPRDSH